MVRKSGNIILGIFSLLASFVFGAGMMEGLKHFSPNLLEFTAAKVAVISGLIITIAATIGFAILGIRFFLHARKMTS